MIIAYIAHPISGDIEANLADLQRIVRRINLEHPDVVPFVPYYADIVSMDDNIPEERSRGIKNDTEIIRRGIPDEVWLTGERISAGMAMEVLAAKQSGIAIIDKIGLL